MTLWFLFILVPFAAVAAILWNHRRKQAAREQLSDERWQSLMIERSAAPSPQSAAPAAALQPAPLRSRERVLDPAHTLLYFLLKSGLPDCEVLPRVTLDRLLEGGDGSAAGPARLAGHTVDFVVCDKGMRPLAAVDLLASEAPAALTTAQDVATRSLAQSGIRHVRLVRSALPKRDALRAVILGP